jgi:hypothetical protein
VSVVRDPNLTTFHVYPVMPRNYTWPSQSLFSVPIVAENRLAIIAPANDMINRSEVFDAKGSNDEAKLCPAGNPKQHIHPCMPDPTSAVPVGSERWQLGHFTSEHGKKTFCELATARMSEEATRKVKCSFSRPDRDQRSRRRESHERIRGRDGRSDLALHRRLYGHVPLTRWF